VYLWKRIHSDNKQDSEEPLRILQSEFNRAVGKVSTDVLGWKEKMSPMNVKREMERDHKYVKNKCHNWGDGSGPRTYIIENPKKYIKHLKKFDFKNYNENAVDWDGWMGIDDDDSDNSSDPLGD
jgi:hypothetical protein